MLDHAAVDLSIVVCLELYQWSFKIYRAMALLKFLSRSYKAADRDFQRLSSGSPQTGHACH